MAMQIFLRGFMRIVFIFMIIVVQFMGLIFRFWRISIEIRHLTIQSFGQTWFHRCGYRRNIGSNRRRWLGRCIKMVAIIGHHEVVGLFLGYSGFMRHQHWRSSKHVTEWIIKQVQNAGGIQISIPKIKI